MTLLHTLPDDHPLRNRALTGAYYKYPESTIWRAVLPGFGISNKTYNQLGNTWLMNIFTFDKPKPPTTTTS